MNIQRTIGKLENEIERSKIRIEQADKNLSELRTEWQKIYATKGGMCPTCGQKLPAEKFNATKDKKITEISTQGKRLRVERDQLANEISFKNNELENFKRLADKVQSQIDAAKLFF